MISTPVTAEVCTCRKETTIKSGKRKKLKVCDVFRNLGKENFFGFGKKSSTFLNQPFAKFSDIVKKLRVSVTMP